MATVTDNTTLFDDWEAGSTVTSPGGGPGGGSDTSNFIQGSGSWSRRQSARTNHGMYVDRGATIDLSGTGQHICFWLMHLNRGLISNVQIYLGDATNNDLHTLTVDSISFPQTGGWAPIWLDCDRTAENTSGTGATLTAVDIHGLELDISTASGTTNNLYLDSSNYTTTGYALAGTSGVWNDFVTHENTNRHGVLIEQNGLITTFARLTLGTASSLVFDDSNFTLAFPDQSLVESTFMGITIDLQNASTNIDWANGIIQSGDPAGATNRPDLIVSGTSGAFDATACVLNGLRVIELTSVCTFTDGTINNTGRIDANEADINGCTIINSTVAADEGAVFDDRTTTVATSLTEYTNCSFTMGANNHHAYRFGTGVDDDLTITGNDFFGFSGTDDVNASIFRFDATTGSLDLNLVGCTNDGGGFSVDDAAGVTVTVVVDPVSTLVNVKDNNNVDLEDARVFLEPSDGTGDLVFEAAITSISRVTTVATASATGHGLSVGDDIVIRGPNETNFNGVTTVATVPNVNEFTYTVTDAGATSATGSNFTVSEYLISGLTDVNGDISVSQTFGLDTPVKGVVRKSTSSPRFKSFDIAGTVDASSGLTINVRMILDE
jgi:hypothetical protein